MFELQKASRGHFISLLTLCELVSFSARDLQVAKCVKAFNLQYLESATSFKHGKQSLLNLSFCCHVVQTRGFVATT